LKVAIEGHTDSVGTEDYNLQLSKQRADAVREYLVKEGVQEDVITAIGLGMSQPIAGNESADGRKKNRRVELVVSGDAIGVAAKDQERMN
jgi:outer membrane protein OmpA-like peptidoglycan-associated protein